MVCRTHSYVSLSFGLDLNLGSRSESRLLTRFSTRGGRNPKLTDREIFLGFVSGKDNVFHRRPHVTPIGGLSLLFSGTGFH